MLEGRATVDDVFLVKVEGIEGREAAAALRDFKVGRERGREGGREGGREETREWMSLERRRDGKKREKGGKRGKEERERHEREALSLRPFLPLSALIHP